MLLLQLGIDVLCDYEEVENILLEEDNGGQGNTQAFSNWVKLSGVAQRNNPRSSLHTENSGQRIKNGGLANQSGQGANRGRSPSDDRVHKKVLNPKYQQLFAETEMKVSPRDYSFASQSGP